VKGHRRTSAMEAEIAECLRAARLPEVQFSEDRPVSSEDFPEGGKRRTLEAMEKGLELLGGYSKGASISQTVARSIYAPLILICGENAQSAPWTTPDHISAAYRLLSLARSAFAVSSTSQLFLSTGGGNFASGQMVRWCIGDLSERLDKAVWKRHPGAQAAFCWMVFQVSFPDLSAFLPEFLPFSLRFVDDWETGNKVRGVLSLKHIVRNVSPTELKWHGRSDLIESTFMQLLSVRDAELAAVLLPAFLDFVGVVGRVQGKSKFDGCDRLTGKLLENLALSSDPETRRCYASHLTQLVALQGVRFVRWQTRFFDAASTALAIEDFETRLAILEAVEKVLEVCGEQVRPHARSALEMLLRLLYEYAKAGGDDDRAFTLTKRCFLRVAGVAREEFAVLCDGMDKVKVCQEFDSVINEAFALPPISDE